MIVKECDTVSTQSKSTTLLAYEAAVFCGAKDDRKRILHFAHQCGVQNFGFSAAGFFNIDNSVLFIMLQLITTYVIVLVQFEENGSTS